MEFNYHATCVQHEAEKKHDNDDEIGAKESVKLDFRHLFIVM